VRCPFLREEQVKSCQAAPFRNSLARVRVSGEVERCTSPDYASCPVAPPRREAHADASHCPFLRESLVQFCAASPRVTYVPWSDSPELRCAHDGHRFCELFLATAGASGRGPALASAPEERGVASVAGVEVPRWLSYSENHMWLDEGDDGICHVGVDAFVTRLVGSLDRLTFPVVKGEARPAVVLTAHGVELTLVFPRPMPLLAANTRLRSRVERLTEDPYGLGWLFAARWQAGRHARPEPPLAAGLRRGPAACEWMALEVRRLATVVHERLLPSCDGGALAADGGDPAPGFLADLAREEIARLFASFFPLPDTARVP
jgi:glycine cleavage system H lipoate-binding protein